MTVRGLITGVLAVAALLFGAPVAAELDDAAVLAALRGGGLTVYFRHAQTDWSQYDDVRGDEDIVLCDPARIRQLSGEGRDTARAIGEAIRRLDVPVGRVLASPYCRTVQTAELLGLGAVTTTGAVMNLRVAERFGGRTAIVERARALLARPVPAGDNVVVVAHGNVAREATPVYPDEAEAVAFRADGDGGFTVVARIPPARWQRLLQLLSPPRN